MWAQGWRDRSHKNQPLWGSDSSVRASVFPLSNGTTTCSHPCQVSRGLEGALAAHSVLVPHGSSPHAAGEEAEATEIQGRASGPSPLRAVGWGILMGSGDLLEAFPGGLGPFFRQILYRMPPEIEAAFFPALYSLF